MNIWVDITTPPQVLLLKPIMEELCRRKHNLVITTRHATETVPLMAQVDMPYTTLGAHGGKTRLGKVTATLWRSLRLAVYLHGKSVSIAFSSSSYSQALTARLLRIPLVVMNDYEGNPGMHLVCRAARKILVPERLDATRLYRFGAVPKQICIYHGLKESVYLNDFVPDPSFRQKLGATPERIVVTMRPASEIAAYHAFENHLFDDALRYVTGHENVLVVLLPRTAVQRHRFEQLQLSNVLVPERVLDGPNLVFASDLVVGAGGTMNREAVVLGTPAYSLFEGPLGSVDAYLIGCGCLDHIRQASDLPRIRVARKTPARQWRHGTGRDLIDEIVGEVLAVVDGGA